MHSGCSAQAIKNTDPSRALLGSGAGQSNTLPVRCMSVLHALDRTERRRGAALVERETGGPPGGLMCP